MAHSSHYSNTLEISLYVFFSRIVSSSPKFILLLKFLDFKVQLLKKNKKNKKLFKAQLSCRSIDFWVRSLANKLFVLNFIKHKGWWRSWLARRSHSFWVILRSRVRASLTPLLFFNKAILCWQMVHFF